MNMNIREFLANDTTVQTRLPPEAYSAKKEQKVLGITWNSSNDIVSISCTLPNATNITKRKVAQHIASIYDRLGWLVPLLIPLKWDCLKEPEFGVYLEDTLITTEQHHLVVLEQPIFRTAFSSTTDVRHVNWRCAETLIYQGEEVKRSTDVILHDVIPDAIFGALNSSSPYKLAYLLMVLAQSHVSEVWRTVILLDRPFNLIAPSGLGKASSFYQKRCIYATLSSVAETGNVALAYPLRSRWKATNMTVATVMTGNYALNYPWTDWSLTNLKLRKNLIVLAECFKKSVRLLRIGVRKGWPSS
uniref:RNase H domain-containing protein n=1 Tax=Haemonchus contortus TaxID=6289 RepID=A0A7I4YWR8_HAECO